MSFDIVSTINKTLPKGLELHLFGQADDGSLSKHSFTGPNTFLDKRLSGLEKDGTFDEILTPGINKLDRAAMVHDLAYKKYKDKENRHNADRVLIRVAEEVIDDDESTLIQKSNARLVKLVMTGKVKLGVGVSEAKFAPDNFTPINVAIGLVTLAASIGIPALIKLIEKER
jgi:myosin-crossreactive antigen